MTAIVNSTVDPATIQFGHKWTFGTFVSRNQNSWEPKELWTIVSIKDFWGFINNEIMPEKWQLSKSLPELWFFKEGLKPHWDIVKKETGSAELVELTFTNSNKPGLLDALMFVFGEIHENASDLVGIRIKPKNNGGEFRLWITNKSSASKIQQFLHNHLKLIDGGKNVKCKSAIL